MTNTGIVFLQYVRDFFKFMAISDNVVFKFTIKTSYVVLGKLNKKYPNHQAQNETVLEKYVRKLEELVSYQIYMGQTIKSTSSTVFFMDLTRLNGTGPSIKRNGEKKIRLHKWLSENGVDIIKTLEEGTKAGKVVSKIKFTSNAVISYETVSKVMNGIQLNELSVYLKEKVKKFDIQKEFEWENNTPDGTFESPINMESVFNFIAMTLEKYKKSPSREQELLFGQAVRLYCIGAHRDGKLLQKIKKSFFGRDYYTGTNVQNMKKSLRAAALGDAYEYDMTSCAIAWKMYRLGQVSSEFKDMVYLGNNFSATLQFLNSKKTFFKKIRNNVFSNISSVGQERQKEMIKVAFNSICFGAKIGTAVWYEGNERMESSIAKYFDNPSINAAFTNCPDVRKFYQEQIEINKLIVKDEIGKNPKIISLKELKTEAGNGSNNKIMSYLFQHGETTIMNEVRNELKNFNVEILANIHDAIVLREELTSYQKRNMVKNVSDKLGHQFLKFGNKHLKASIAVAGVVPLQPVQAVQPVQLIQPIQTVQQVQQVQAIQPVSHSPHI